MAELQFQGLDANNGYYQTVVVNGGEGLLPPGGAPGQILVKATWNDYDAVWATAYIEGDGTGGGGTGAGGDIVLDSIAPIRVSGGGSAWTISIDEASQLRPGSMSAPDKRRLDNLPCWVSATAPTQARVNDFWWNTEDGTLYIRYQDKDSIQWVPATPAGGGQGQSVYVGSVPPTAPSQGSLWWNTEDGTGYIWYADGDSAAWVPFTPSGGGQSQGIYFGDVPPSDPTAWGGWFDTTIGTTFLWFDDGNSAQWVPASPQGGGQNESIDEGFYGSN